jgi:hypothetical protein
MPIETSASPDIRFGYGSGSIETVHPQDLERTGERLLQPE